MLHPVPEHAPLSFLNYLRTNNYIGAKGKEYSKDETDRAWQAKTHLVSEREGAKLWANHKRRNKLLDNAKQLNNGAEILPIITIFRRIKND